MSLAEGISKRSAAERLSAVAERKSVLNGGVVTAINRRKESGIGNSASVKLAVANWSSAGESTWNYLFAPIRIRFQEFAATNTTRTIRGILDCNCANTSVAVVAANMLKPSKAHSA